MKGFRLIAGAFMLLLVFACFISVPVFGENPWDADGTNGSDSETDVDTTGPDGVIEEDDSIGGQGDDPDWLTSMLFQLSYRFLTGFLLDSRLVTVTPQVAAN